MEGKDALVSSNRICVNEEWVNLFGQRKRPYDPRPIFGGKVVIQAKRYKDTVGVSAVRDLFGTMQNEGASKGILVTTSGYGKAAFDFAAGKPLELLDGANLLVLLLDHARLDARIVMSR